MGFYSGSAAGLLPGAPFLTFVQSLNLTSNVLESLVNPVTVWTQGTFSLSQRMQRPWRLFLCFSGFIVHGEKSFHDISKQSFRIQLGGGFLVRTISVMMTTAIFSVWPNFPFLLCTHPGHYTFFSFACGLRTEWMLRNLLDHTPSRFPLLPPCPLFHP